MNTKQAPYNFRRHRADLYELENLNGPEVGQQATDFVATILDGKQVRLSDFDGKIIVLENGSATCPQYVGNAARMNQLPARFPDVEFLMLYTREAHPGENIREHHSFEDKMVMAQSICETIGEHRTILVDDLDGSGHLAYGSLPNMIYIIDEDGTVVFRGHWNNPGAVEKVLTKLQQRQSVAGLRSPFRMVSPTAMKVIAKAGPTAIFDAMLCFPRVMWIHLKQEVVAALH